MAVRIVYVLNNKAPDIIQDAESWQFHEGFLRILGKLVGSCQRRLMIEIRADFVLSVEHVDLECDAEKVPEEPEKAPEEAPKPKKRAKRAR